MRLKAGAAKVKRGTGFLKSGGVLREGTEMKYRMVERCRDAFPCA